MDKVSVTLRKLLKEIDSYTASFVNPACLTMFEKYEQATSSVLSNKTISPQVEWVLGERVGDWLERRISACNYLSEDLPNLIGLSKLTIERLRKSDKHFINIHKNSEFCLNMSLGIYGYPSSLQILLRIADVKITSYQGQIIEKIIDKEQEKICKLRKSIPHLERQNAMRWLMEFELVLEKICSKVSSRFALGGTGIVTRNIIKLSLFDGLTRLERYVGEEQASKLHSEINGSFSAAISKINKDILGDNISNSVILKIFEIGEEQLDQIYWNDDEEIKLDVIGKINCFCYEYELNLLARKKIEFENQYGKISLLNAFGNTHDGVNSSEYYRVCNVCEPRSFVDKSNLNGEEISSFTSMNSSYSQINSFYLSNNCERRFGVMLPFQSENFEVKLSLCKTCAEKYSEFFASPISSILRKIRLKHQLDQDRIAQELKVSQGIVSKIESDKIPFIKSSLIRNIYGLYFLGKLDENFLSYKSKDKLISEVLSKLEMSGFEFNEIEVDKRVAITPDKYIRCQTNYNAMLEVGCDVFVKSIKRNINIACFTLCTNTGELSFYLSVSRMLKATHIFVNNSLCIDIRNWKQVRCSLPLNSPVTMVRNLEEKSKYCELDIAMSKIEGISYIITSLRDKDFSVNHSEFDILKLEIENSIRSLQIINYKPKPKPKPKEERESSGINYEYESIYDMQMRRMDKLKSFIRGSNDYTSGRKGDFVIHYSAYNHLLRKNIDGADIFLIPFVYWDEMQPEREWAYIFQKEICDSLRRKNKKISEVAETYQVHEDIIYVWLESLGYDWWR